MSLKNAKRWLLGAANLAGCLAGLLIGPVVHAKDSFPSHPLTIVVSYPPGGSSDPVARLMAQHMSKSFGQPVIVENRAGAAGTMGAAYVSRAKPDGYTALFAPNGVSLHPVTMKKIAGYDVRHDLAPVSLISTGPYVLAVNADLPVNSVAELIAYAKANPKKLFYGTAGVASPLHLLTELFDRSAGIEMNHVPYKGNGPVLVGLVAGEVQVAMDTVTSARPLMETGRLKILAVTGNTRNAMLPDVPTLDEAGVHGVDGVLWQAFFLPKNTPAPLVARWNAAVLAALQVPAVRSMLGELGFDVLGSTPAGLTERINRDIVQWETIVKNANIPLD